MIAGLALNGMKLNDRITSWLQSAFEFNGGCLRLGPTKPPFNSLTVQLDVKILKYFTPEECEFQFEMHKKICAIRD